MNRQRQAAMMKGGYDRKGECVNMSSKRGIFLFFLNHNSVNRYYEFGVSV